MVPGSRKAADYREALLARGATQIVTQVEAQTDTEPDAEPDIVECRETHIDAALHGQRLDKVLVALAPEFSRSHIQQLIEGGHARVQGLEARVPARRMRVAEAVALDLVPTAESRAFRPEAGVLAPEAVVYEDAHLLVVHKPAGLVVHPAAGHWSGTLLNGLLAHHAAAAALPRAGIVHRLDKDTSGLMLVGKTLPAVTALMRDIAARRVHRSYLALAWGEVPGRSSFDAPIGRDPRSRLRMAVLGLPRGGKEARTDVECLVTTGGISALRCTLHTGRTHQIRVHLSAKGWPLVADALYGGRPALGLERQALHARRLVLQHPVTGKALTFTAPPPPDFAAAWARVAGATMPPD